jgi:hypothetical protein
VEEISKYNLDLVVRRSDGTEVAMNQQATKRFSVEKGMKIMNYVQVFSYIRESHHNDNIVTKMSLFIAKARLFVITQLSRW